MTRCRDKLAAAVRVGLSITIAGGGSAAAQTSQRDSTTYDASPAAAVTGSHIRRTDTRAAGPVTIIDRAAIAQSGKLTLGELLQDLPAISGPLTNPRVNIGGGTGAATISLHGLGAARTLLLINGHRVLSDDVNTVPASAIERIEILTEGAAAVYGSDAVGGVVNFILRSDYQGAEFTSQFGVSGHGDGRRRGYQFLFGQSTDKGSILAGVDYNQFDAVLAANRKFSRNALYYYYGAGHVSPGSSRTPTGTVQLPPNLAGVFGCPIVTLRQLGLTGSTLGDYKCYTAADSYNFQANGNVDLTPQERGSAFLIGNYNLTDAVQTYVEWYHNKTNAASSLPPQAIDSLFPLFVISADNYYNPFGVEFSPGENRFRARTVGNGNRVTANNVQTDQITSGFRGGFGDDWHWNVYFNYGHFDRLTHTTGYVDVNKLGAALGPSYRDANGNIVCGTPSSGPTANCTPVDLFDIVAPGTIAALNLTANDTFTNVAGLDRSEIAEMDGHLFELPAGAVQLAAGVSHRRQALHTIRDATEVADANGVCDIGSGCVASLDGAYSVREAYAEAFVPLLKDLPFAQALNLSVADRQSKYSSFGSTNNAKVALEWRVQQELLLRATVADVFRAPTITELYQGPQLSFADYVDPCYTTSGPNAACQYLPPGGLPRHPGVTSFSDALVSGAAAAGTPLGPEHGKSFDYALVYDPHWLPGFSLGVDAWRLYLNDEIHRVTPQQVLDSCFYANGGPFCAAIHRFPNGPTQGEIASLSAPFGNLGRLDTNGVDLSARYRLPFDRYGNFAVNFQTTYLGRFTEDPIPGAPNDFVHEYAGHYTTGASPIPNANFSRWRALATLNWDHGPWRAQWTTRYIGKFTVGYSTLNYNESACYSSAPPRCELKYGATVYHNISAGYGIDALNARVDAGIDNAFDKQPQVLYLNNAPNANVDVNSFDTVGRFYWVRMSVKF